MWRLRWTLLKRFMSLSPAAGGKRNWLVIGIFAMFVLLTSRLATRLFDTLRLTPEIGAALSFRVVAMATLSFALMLMFSSLVSAAIVMFSNPENELLSALPISRRKVYTLRFLESMAATGWMVFLFGTPIAAGLGRSFVAGWEYVVVAGLSLLGLIVLPTALGVFLICLTFVCVPRHRAKALLFSLGGLAAYVCVSFAARVDIGVLFTMEFDPTIHLDNILRAIEVPSHPFTPDTLAAQAMASMARAEPLAAWKNLAILWLENAAGLCLLMTAGYPLFVRGMAQTEQREVHLRSMLPFSLSRLRASPFLSLCLKDTKFLYRNIGEWSQILVLLTLVFVHVVNIRDLPLDQVYLKNFVSFINLAVSGLLVVAVAVRFVYPTFTLEGDGAYLLKILPVSPAAILRYKFWTSAIPLLILSQLLLFVTNQQTGVSAFFFIFSHIVCALQTLAIVLLALIAGLVMPPQTRSSLERAAGSTGGLLFMIGGSLYITAAVAFFTAPIYKMLLLVPFSAALFGPISKLMLVFVFAHLVCYWLGTRLASRQLAYL